MNQTTLPILKIILNIVMFSLLTVLTQIGGIVYLISQWSYKKMDHRIKRNFYKWIFKINWFLFLYGISTFFILPWIAKPLGRVPLSISTENHVRPLNIMTCVLNRNYVKPSLKKTIEEVGIQMNEQFPGTIINYLDANFPLIDHFPLLPHLSHNDGKKLDLSFCYLDAKSTQFSNHCPSFIGYGICEEPRQAEKNMAEVCSSRGYKQYNILRKIISQQNKQAFIFDSIRTKELINLLAAQSTIKKIFIEPHLKTRMQLTSEKIRFHGCQAVRHDDHIHVEIR